LVLTVDDDVLVELLPVDDDSVEIVVRTVLAAVVLEVAMVDDDILVELLTVEVVTLVAPPESASLSVARHASASASVLCGQLTESGTVEPGNTSFWPGSSRNACCLATSSTTRGESTTSYDQPTAAVAVSSASIATGQTPHDL
jgi:hypothetical protein